MMISEKESVTKKWGTETNHHGNVDYEQINSGNLKKKTIPIKVRSEHQTCLKIKEHLKIRISWKKQINLLTEIHTLFIVYSR